MTARSVELLWRLFVDLNDFSSRVASAFLDYAALYDKATALRESPDGDRLLVEALRALERSLEELREANEALREQREEIATIRLALELERRRYHDLIEYAPEARLVTDAYGVITDANRAASLLFEMPILSLKGKPLVVFVAEDERPGFRRHITNLEHLDDSDWDTTFRGHRGTVFDASITVAALRGVNGNLDTLRWLIREVRSPVKAIETILRGRVEAGLVEAVSFAGPVGGDQSE